MKTSQTRLLRRAKAAHVVEPLEARIAPASTVTLLASGDITVLDGMNANDAITISLAGANLHFFDPNGIIAGNNAAQIDTSNVEVPLNALIGKLMVDTGSQPQDRVTFAAGLPLLSGVEIHTQTLTPLPALAIGTNGLDLTATLGNINITGTIDAGGGIVSLHAGNAIVTAPTAAVTAGTINATAVNGITLRMDANSINAMNVNNGGITLNELNTVVINSLNAGGGGIILNSGSFLLGGNNALAGAPNVTVDGTLELNGFSVNIGTLSGGGNVINSVAAANLSLTVNSGSAIFSGPISGNIAVHKDGLGTETFSGPQSYPALTTDEGTMNLLTSLPNATILLHAGGVVNFFGNNAGSTINVFGDNAVANFGASQLLAALNIGDAFSNGTATLTPHAPGGSAFVLDTGALTFGNLTGCKLDLTNNAMVVRNGDLATITAQLTSGLATSVGGYWNGAGINSSAAASDPQAITALGVLDNNTYGYTNLAGVPLTGTGHDILVRFTYYGDANLSGVVDGVDYGLTDSGFNSPGLVGWLNGDYDYSGVTDASDFSLIDSSYAQQVGGPVGQISRWTGATGNDWFDPTNWTNGVPGPADTAVLAKPSGFQPQLTAAATVAFFDLINGTFTGNGVLTVTQGMNWLGGVEGGGTTSVEATASLNIAGLTGKVLSAHTLTIAGSTVANTAATIQLDNGGTLQAGATLTTTLSFSLLPGGGVIDTNGFNVTLGAGSTIDGTGALTKIGAGTLTFGGTSSYQGITDIVAGTLATAGDNRLSPNTTVAVNGGTLAIGTFNQTVSGVTLNTGNITGTTGKLNASSSISLNGGTVTADLVSNAINVSGANVNANLDANAGAVFLNSGSWKIRSSYSTGSNLAVTGGTLDLGTFTLDVGALNVTGGNVTSNNGTINGFGAVTVANATVNANLSSITGIVVDSGTVNGNLNAADTSIILNGGTVTYTSSVFTNTPVTISGGNLVLGANNVTFGGMTINSGSITATTGKLFAELTVNGGTVNANVDAGNSTITLNGGIFTPNTSFSIASTLILNGGTFALGTNTASFGGVTVNAGDITGKGTLTSSTDFALSSGTITAKLAGNVGLVKNGPGTVVLANAKNTFIGTVVINGGVLQIAANLALGDVSNMVIINDATLKTTSSITTSRNIDVNGAAPTVEVAAGTLTLLGTVGGAGALQKTGPGTLVLGSNFVGTTVISAGLTSTSIGGTKVKFTGAGTITITVVPDGVGGTRISTVELADTDATTVLAINGPRAPATTTIDTIKSLDPNDEIGTIKLGKTVIIGSGLNDAIADVDIHGKVNKLLFNDVGSYTLFELGKGLPYNNVGDETTPDSYNNHPDIQLRNVLGTGVIIDVTGDGVTPGGVGGGGLGKVVVNQWDQPGLVKTTQSIGYFKFKHGDCNVVFEVDKDELGVATTAGIGKMLVPNGAWGSSGSIIEGNVTVFSAAQFLAAANITAGSMTKLLVKKGPYLGTTTLKNPDAPALGTFSVNGDYVGYIDSAQAMINLNIKGTFKGSLKSKSIGSISAYSFNGLVALNDDPVGDPARHNIYVTDGSLGTIKTSAGGIKDFEIVVATIFNGFNIQWPTAPSGAIGIDNVTVAAGQINNVTVKLAAGVPNALSYGIKNSILESAGSIGNLTSSHSVSGSIFAATTTMGNVTFSADLLGSKLLAGTSLGGDGEFDGDETFLRAGKIGNVKALGTFGTTTIAVGVDPGPAFIYGDGDDVAAPGSPTLKALGALTFGAASGGLFGPAGIIHTDAIEAATIKSLKVGAAPALKAFATSHYIRAGGSEAASDVLVQLV